MAPKPVETSVRCLDGEVIVVSVAGDLDMATAPLLHDAIAAARTLTGRALIIDLTAVEFMGSAGLRLLVETHEVVTPSMPFAIVAATVGTRRPLEITNLDELLAAYPTLDSAHQAVRQQRPRS